MSDNSVHYNIIQLQNDIERLQRDLSRLQKDTSPERSIGYPQAQNTDELHVEENLLETSIFNTQNKRSLFSEEAVVESLIEQEEIRELSHLVAQEIAQSTVKKLNMINPAERQERLRNTIVSLITAAQALIEIEVALSAKNKD